MPLLDNCRILVNPFFDITCINASLWFARASFDQQLMMIHDDIVLSNELAADLFSAKVGHSSHTTASIHDPEEIIIVADEKCITYFDVHYSGCHSAYACEFK